MDATPEQKQAILDLFFDLLNKEIPTPLISNLAHQNIVIDPLEAAVVALCQVRSFDDFQRYDFENMNFIEKYAYQLLAFFRTFKFEEDIYMYWKRILEYQTLEFPRKCPTHNQFFCSDVECQKVLYFKDMIDSL